MRERDGYLAFAAIAFIVFFVTVVACGDDDDDDDDDSGDDDASDDDDSGDDDASDDDADACDLADSCVELVACEYYGDEEFCAEALVDDCASEEGRAAIESCLCECVSAAADCDAISACVDECVGACYEA